MKLQHIKEINQQIKDDKHILKLLTYSSTDERQEIKNRIETLKELKTIKKYSEIKNKKDFLKIIEQKHRHIYKEDLTDQQIKEIKRQDYFIYKDLIFCERNQLQ